MEEQISVKFKMDFNKELKQSLRIKLEGTCNDFMGNIQALCNIDDGFVGFDSPGYNKYNASLHDLVEAVFMILEEQSNGKMRNLQC